MNDRKITIEMTKDEYHAFLNVLGQVAANPQKITQEQRELTVKIHKAVRAEAV